jgi:hypothetical protein
MSDLLERHTTTDREAIAPTPTTTTAPTTTPPPGTIGPTAPRPAPWPRNAKILVAILAVAGLIGSIGAILAVTADDGSDDLEGQVAELTQERDQLAAQQTELTDERDELAATRGELAVRVAVLDAELMAARADVTRLTGQLATLEEERDTLQIELAAAGSLVTELEEELGVAVSRTAMLDERIAALDAEITALEIRAVTAEQARDELAALFPITFDATVDDISLVGAWDVDWDEAYCDGFPICGTTPSYDRLSIVETPEGWLRVEIDGVLDAGLFRVDGALYAIAPSTTAVPACDGTARTATVSVTLYPHGVSIADDGTHQVTDLGMSMLVQAPATGSCPAGTVFYGGNVTPA